MMDLMYTPLESVFNATMEREGRTVTAYTSGAEFRAFMRRNDDGNNFEDRITLFYPVAAPITQGSIISFGNKLYILVNRETEENHCYYKSSGLACNGMITLNDGTLAGIPCYVYNMGNGLGDDGKVISMISGNMEFITESNTLSRSLAINNTFNEFGRTWKINNIYYKDGILHVIAEVYADQTPKEKLVVEIDGMQNVYKVGNTTRLKVTLYQNTHITVGTVVWSSSDNAIATVDGEGNVVFIKEGFVRFTAYWVEKNHTHKTELVTVRNDAPVNPEYTAKLSGREDIRLGYSRTYVANLYNARGIEVDGVWEFDICFSRPELITTSQDGNRFTVSVSDDESIIDGELIIIATETVHNVSASIVVTVQAPNF